MNSFIRIFVFRNVSTNKGQPTDVATMALASDKTDGTVALVKSDPEKVKSTPAGEYLTAALNDFDPEQYEGLATISDGANKLLMLVCLCCLFPLTYFYYAICVRCSK